MTTDLTALRISEHLEKYVFDKIWNDPYTEYRTFTVAECLTKVATAGIFFGRYSQIQLPSEVPYKSSRSKLFFYVYAIPAAMFRSLRLKVLTWTSLAKFCTDNLIDIELFSEDGRRCIRDGVFIRQADKNDCILVAVETTAFQACFGADYSSARKIFFGEMFDSDLHPSVKYVEMKLKTTDLPSNSIRPKGYDPITVDGKPTYTMYNGKLLTGDYVKHLAAGALVENVFDENIVGYFDTPATGREAPSYDAYHTLIHRLLIHIPKELNDERFIITPNTCDIYLVPTKMTTGHPEMSGIYLYQCGRGEHFHQLTHNDFGIDKDWLDEIARANEFEEYFVRVYVRILDQDKKAIRDANYINVLYSHTDEEIVDFLLGRSSYPIDFWTAPVLERGLYGKCGLLRRRMTTDYTLNDYIDLVGYYHTLALIGKRVTHFEITKESKGTREFVVRAPLALQDYGVDDYFPIVYLNGIRVDPENVSLLPGINADNVNCKELVFTPDASWWTKVIDVNYSLRVRVILQNVPLQIGDKVVVELLDNQKHGSMRHFNLVVPGSTIQMQTKDEWKVYQVYDEPLFRYEQTWDEFVRSGTVYYKWDERSHDYVKATGLEIGQPINLLDYALFEKRENSHVENVTYQPINDPGEFDEETKVLTLKSEWLGVDLVVVEGNITLENRGGCTITDKIDGWMGHDMWHNPITTCDNFPMDNETVFMNDKRLIRGLDYTMEGYTSHDFHSGAKLYLQNVSWLKKSNHYEVIRTNQMTLSNQRGFLRGNIVYWNHQNPFWFDELSILNIGGLVCSNIVHDGFGTITLLDYHHNGIPFEFRMTVSSKIKKIVGDHGEAEDNRRLEVIKAYFDSKYTPPYHQTIVKKSYKIYSLYLEQIINAYFNDPEFDFELTPSDVVFEEQFVDFTDWKRRDVAYSLSPEDLKYVDVYPIFNRLRTENRYDYYKITQLAKRLLPSDHIKHKDISNVK